MTASAKSPSTLFANDAFKVEDLDVEFEEIRFEEKPEPTTTFTDNVQLDTEMSEITHRPSNKLVADKDETIVRPTSTRRITDYNPRLNSSSLKTVKTPKIILHDMTVDESSTDGPIDFPTRSKSFNKKSNDTLYLEDDDEIDDLGEMRVTNSANFSKTARSAKSVRTISSVRFSMPMNEDEDENEFNDHADIGVIELGALKSKDNRKLLVTNTISYALEPAVPDQTVQCKVLRRKGTSPEYTMSLENLKDNSLTDILVARKKTSYYVISALTLYDSQPTEIPIARTVKNVLGTQFIICSMGTKTASVLRVDKNDESSERPPDLRIEYVSIMYELNILGLKGPRQMTIVIPGMDSKCVRRDYIPDTDDDTIVNTYNKLQKQNSKKQPSNNTNNNDEASNIITLVNKKPVWNDEIKCFTLDFNHRITQTSVKNFQVIHPNKEKYIIMQFGRAEKEEFACDFTYPLCALQAFGIALSSLDTKIGCE